MQYITGFNAGEFRNELGYTCFFPKDIHCKWEGADNKLNSLSMEAMHLLGKLDATADRVPNINKFLRLHITREAVQSSKIEGTQTVVDEALMEAKNLREEQRDDWQEVHNYIEALLFAINGLKELPVSTRLLKQTHQLLMKGVRGHNKQPGEYRRSQNWIGGSSLKDAVFVPPPQYEVGRLMSDLEKFLHDEEVGVPPIIRAGIAHYQFETIHPFLDGNGRIGRLLIILYFVDKGLLSLPLLYLSDYIESSRKEYYSLLTKVRMEGDLLAWLYYYVEGVIATSKKAIMTLNKVKALKDDLETAIRLELGQRTGNALLLLEWLFELPMINASMVSNQLGVAPSTANTLIAEFEKRDWLQQVNQGNRNRVFRFEPYVALYR